MQTVTKKKPESWYEYKKMDFKILKKCITIDNEGCFIFLRSSIHKDDYRIILNIHRFKHRAPNIWREKKKTELKKQTRNLYQKIKSHVTSTPTRNNENYS